MSVWIRRWVCLAGTYTALRVMFLIFNFHPLSQLSRLALAEAFVAGLRFDLAALATLNAPLMVIHLCRYSTQSRSFRTLTDNFVSVLFLIANVPFLVVGITDTKLFSFTGRRTTPDFFGITGDIVGQGFSIMFQYWWLTLMGLISLYLLAYFSWQKSHDTKPMFNGRPIGHKILILLGFAGSSVLAARGGLQRKPLAPAHAYIYQPPVLANLVLNSTMTLLRSPSTEGPSRYQDFESMAEIRVVLTPSAGDGPPRVPLAPGKNVVVLVVESLATEYVGALNRGQGYTPFLDSLMETSVTFRESFANGRRSIDAMPSIFAALPAWRDQPYVTSSFSGNQIQALPRLLKIQGYETYFFHGAANGSMHFDVFSAMAGFDHYIGENEYPGDGDRDGSWGVYDEPFLEFAADTLNKETKPFIAGIFTLSSHNPFSIPKKYKGKFPKGSLPIHESIGYADQSLRMFFAKAGKMPWFKNTIFVITGDHTSLTDRPGYDNVLGRFRVPIVFYDPAGSLPLVGKFKIAQQADITPSLLDLLGLTPDKPSLAGWSLFDPAFQGRFIQHEYGHWYYYDDSTLLRLTEGNQVESFDLLDLTFKTPKPLGAESATSGQVLKASRQYYLNGLIDDAWHK